MCRARWDSNACIWFLFLFYPTAESRRCGGNVARHNQVLVNGKREDTLLPFPSPPIISLARSLGGRSYNPKAQASGHPHTASSIASCSAAASFPYRIQWRLLISGWCFLERESSHRYINGAGAAIAPGKGRTTTELIATTVTTCRQ